MATSKTGVPRLLKGWLLRWRSPLTRYPRFCVQRERLEELLTILRQLYPQALITGHNHLTPHAPKACPCFDAEWAIATGGGTVDHDKADTISGMAHEFDLALQDGFADRNHGYKQDWSPKAPKRVALNGTRRYSLLGEKTTLVKVNINGTQVPEEEGGGSDRPEIE